MSVERHRQLIALSTCWVVVDADAQPHAFLEPRSVSVNDPSGQYLVEVLFPEVPEAPGEWAPALITVRDKNTLETSTPPGLYIGRGAFR